MAECPASPDPLVDDALALLDRARRELRRDLPPDGALLANVARLLAELDEGPAPPRGRMLGLLADLEALEREAVMAQARVRQRLETEARHRSAGRAYGPRAGGSTP